MKIEEQKIKFINLSMNTIYDLCDELYEVLVDEDYSRVDYITKDILEVLKDLNQTFHNEI
jgi:t-SNARE complex subunit (syntaxin)